MRAQLLSRFRLSIKQFQPLLQQIRCKIFRNLKNAILCFKNIFLQTSEVYIKWYNCKVQNVLELEKIQSKGKKWQCIEAILYFLNIDNLFEKKNTLSRFSIQIEKK
jgi:hypothetical protein